MSIWVISNIIIVILFATAVYLGSFKVDVKPKLLKEEGDLTSRRKILDRIASIYLFLFLLIITLGSWIVLGFIIRDGLVPNNWSFSHSLMVSFSAVFGILSLFFLLIWWRRGYFDL